MSSTEPPDKAPSNPPGSPSGDSPKGINTEAVSAWFEDNISGGRAPFSFELIIGGHSNLTYKVTAGDGKFFVLRRPPTGAVLATAHDMSREYLIISSLAETAVPVPDALGLCVDDSVNDAPFYVMSFVDGFVLRDPATVRRTFPEKAERERLSESSVDVLARLHEVDPDAVGLGNLGRKPAYLDRQLKRWKTQWEKSKTRELPAMDESYELLVAAKPEQLYTGIVHGDYRLGNVLASSQGTIAGVLDWELCTLGDTLADLGYTLNDWVEPASARPFEMESQPTAAGGFFTRAQFVSRYSELTERQVSNIDYYRAFQYWRLGAIVEGVLSRYIKGVMGDPGADVEAFKARVDDLAAGALGLLRSTR